MFTRLERIRRTELIGGAIQVADEFKGATKVVVVDPATTIQSHGGLVAADSIAHHVAQFIDHADIVVGWSVGTLTVDPEQFGERFPCVAGYGKPRSRLKFPNYAPGQRRRVDSRTLQGSGY